MTARKSWQTRWKSLPQGERTRRVAGSIGVLVLLGFSVWPLQEGLISPLQYVAAALAGLAVGTLHGRFGPVGGWLGALIDWGASLLPIIPFIVWGGAAGSVPYALFFAASLAVSQMFNPRNRGKPERRPIR